MHRVYLQETLQFLVVQRMVWRPTVLNNFILHVYISKGRDIGYRQAMNVYPELRREQHGPGQVLFHSMEQDLTK
jgi:hypothetical protein